MNDDLKKNRKWNLLWNMELNYEASIFYKELMGLGIIHFFFYEKNLLKSEFFSSSHRNLNIIYIYI